MKYIRSSFWLSVISTSLMLVLFGFFCLATIHSNDFENTLKRNVDIVVELNKGLKATELERIKRVITSFEAYLPESLTHYDEKTALAIMNEELPVNLSFDTLGNPFNPMLSFNIGPQYYPDEISQIEKEILKDSSVLDVTYQHVSFQQIEKNVSTVANYLFILALCLILVTILVLYINFQLLFIKDKKKIKTMLLVGATRSFITMPYLRKASVIGLFAFIISAMLLIIVISFIAFRINLVSDILVSGHVLIVVFLLLLVAIVVPTTSTYIIIRLYLSNANRFL